MNDEQINEVIRLADKVSGAIDPRFSGDWEAHVEPCQCRKQSSAARG